MHCFALEDICGPYHEVKVAPWVKETTLQQAKTQRYPYGRACSLPHTNTCTERRFSQAAFDILRWQRCRNQIFNSPLTMAWLFFPFNSFQCQRTHSPQNLRISRQEDKWTMVFVGASELSENVGGVLLLLFKSDARTRQHTHTHAHTHNDNSLLRPCLLCWKPHSKHGLICRKEAAYSPTLFMLQEGLTEKPHQFVLK